jgi:hypothetical protein
MSPFLLQLNSWSHAGTGDGYNRSFQGHGPPRNSSCCTTHSVGPGNSLIWLVSYTRSALHMNCTSAR